MSILPLVQVLHSLGRNILLVVKIAREDGMQLVKVEFAE